MERQMFINELKQHFDNFVKKIGKTKKNTAASNPHFEYNHHNIN